MSRFVNYKGCWISEEAPHLTKKCDYIQAKEILRGGGIFFVTLIILIAVIRHHFGM